MLTLVEFKPEHLKKIQVKEVHTGEVPQMVMTQAVTIMDGETPVAIFGGFVFVPGVVHFWGLVSEEVKKKPVEFHRLMKRALAFYERDRKPRRIQIDVKVGFVEGEKWAVALGFKREGTMRGFGHAGEDFNLYAKVV